MIPPKVAAAAVLVQTFAMAALFAVALGLFADDDPFDGSARDFLVVGAMHLVDGLVIAALLVGWARLRPEQLGWSTPEQVGRDLVLGLVGALGCVAIVTGCGLVLGGSLGDLVQSYAGMPISQRLLCVLVGLGAAAIEETVFRGTLQPVLVERLGKPAGIVLMALIFSAYHLKFAPAGFLVKALFGILFGSLRQITGRNWAPALAHLGVWTIVGFS